MCVRKNTQNCVLYCVVLSDIEEISDGDIILKEEWTAYLFIFIWHENSAISTFTYSMANLNKDADMFKHTPMAVLSTYIRGEIIKTW